MDSLQALLGQSEAKTRSEYINSLIDLVEDIKEGEGSEDELKETIEGLTEMFEQLKTSMALAKETAPAMENLEEKYQRLFELIDLMNENISSMNAYFDTQDYSVLDDAIENIKPHVEEFFGLVDEF